MLDYAFLSRGVRYISSAINIVIVVLTMCSLTLSSILQKPNKAATAFLKNYTIKKFKIWEQKMYIFTSFHIVKNHMKSAVFSSKISTITNAILVLLVLMLRDLRFRCYITCFAPFRRICFIPNSIMHNPMCMRSILNSM